MAVSIRLVVAALLLQVPTRVLAAPTVDAIVARMHAVLEPDKPSLRRLVLHITGQGGETTEWIAGQARKRIKGGERVATVVLAPESMRGTAFLVEEGKHEDVKWLWNPAIRRVRKIIPLDGQQAFLGSDFTYYDLGIVDRHAQHRLLGEETHDGVRAYRIEEIPRSRWYYSRLVTWVAVDSGFPIERDFYDAAGQLWKVEGFEQITDIDGVPTVLRMRMQDRLQQGSTVIDVSGVRYGADVPDSLFEPGALPDTAAAPIWQGLGPS
ncbi:MAG TPA: outer membrane lipoprotein-sorting protein [Candidatus Binatia bacterium]|nr:outer membrane lipoprotein-sorting protein [Candidatus Binatia bacterium]